MGEYQTIEPWQVNRKLYQQKNSKINRAGSIPAPPPIAASSAYESRKIDVLRLDFSISIVEETFFEK